MWSIGKTWFIKYRFVVYELPVKNSKSADQSSAIDTIVYLPRHLMHFVIMKKDSTELKRVWKVVVEVERDYRTPMLMCVSVLVVCWLCVSISIYCSSFHFQ